MIPEKGHGNPNGEPTGYGCGNHALYYVGDGNGAGDGCVAYGNFLRHGGGVGFYVFCDLPSGSGSGSGAGYAPLENNGNGRGGGITGSQTGNGDSNGDMPYVVGQGNPTDFKSTVMWAALIGERS